MAFVLAIISITTVTLGVHVSFGIKAFSLYISLYDCSSHGSSVFSV